MGSFISKDLWEGENKFPMSYNSWTYGYANPINRIDRTGFYPWCSFITNKVERTECESKFESGTLWPKDITRIIAGVNPDGSPKRNVTIPPPHITWQPAMQVNPASQIFNSQYEVDVDGDGLLDPGEDESPWGPNLCGQIALSMILETTTGRRHMLRSFYEALSRSRSTTSGQDLAEALLKGSGLNGEGWDHWVHAYGNLNKYKLNVDTWEKYLNVQIPNHMNQNDYSMQYARDLMDILTRKHYFIAGVHMNGSGILADRSKGGVGHWVVITGFSAQWHYSSIYAMNNWVRILNPFNNKTEYYRWDEYRKSSSPGIGLELWPKR